MGIKKAMAALLIMTLVGPVFSMAATGKPKAEQIREKAATIPKGSIVRVQVLPQGTDEMTGQFVLVTPDGFEIQNVQTGNVLWISFADVQSLKVKNQTAEALKDVGRIILGVAYVAFTIYGQTAQ